MTAPDMPTNPANRDENGNWLGLHGHEWHRTTGGRAWGPNGEWCYENCPCDYCLTQEHGEFIDVLDRLAEAERRQSEAERDRDHAVAKAKQARADADARAAKLDAMRDERDLLAGIIAHFNDKGYAFVEDVGADEAPKWKVEFLDAFWEQSCIRLTPDEAAVVARILDQGEAS